ncbi:MAG: tyrosine-type recombinase/integrase [Planctomycetia bacterium]|nr:tyrosine-type recombinase/integrase [Planctomycetia bacterium]
MREPKPFFRKSTQSWYFKLGKKFIPLGADKEKAFQKYHALMAASQPTTPDTRVEDLLGKYLTWCKAHKAAGTYKWYSRYLVPLQAYIQTNHGKMTVANIKPSHVADWLDTLGGGDNYKNGAIRAAMRAFNWAVKRQDIAANPIKGVERPQATAREVYIEPAQWDAAIACVKPADPFMDFIVFLKESGCRPQECRAIEKRHFKPMKNQEQIAFPVDESKGKRYARIIPLNLKALAIIQRLSLKYPEGKLFRGKHGQAWGIYSIAKRFAVIRKKIGLEKFHAYAVRHTFITDALLRGVDPVTLAHIVGHKDAAMILKIYQHLNLNRGHIRKALGLATGEDEIKEAM